MSLKTFNPTTPSNRHRSITIRSNLWKGKSINKLTVGLSKQSGRNNLGRITVFTKGGGHSHNYRKIDFKRSLINVSAINLIDKCYIKGQIVNINKNIVNIDTGLQSYIKISKGETSNSSVTKGNMNVGNYIKFFFYKVETPLGDPIIDLKSLKYKIKKKEYKRYKKYKLPILLYNKIIKRYTIKGILLRKRKRKKRVLVGIGGIVSLLLRK